VRLANFTYVKSNGSKSDRTLAVTMEPSKFVEGIDISELSQDEFADFVNEYSKVLDEFKATQQILIDKFDLKHRYRRFIPEQMLNAEIENV
jgi:DNA-binding transcriptional regulator PaaX